MQSELGAHSHLARDAASASKRDVCKREVSPVRHLTLSLLLAAAGVVGLVDSAPAVAHDSSHIYVGIGDVMFSYGRPYYRHTREPLFVVYERGYPRYYRIVRAVPYYAPFARYGFAPRYENRWDRYVHDERYGYDYDRHDRRRDRYDRNDRRGRDDRDRQRGRGWD